MSSPEVNKELEQTEEAGERKGKRRLLDETGKRLLREIKPLWAWILLCALFCLLLIGCAVAEPELLGKQIDKLYDWAKNKTPGLAASLLSGLGLLLGVYALEGLMTYGKYFFLQHIGLLYVRRVLLLWR